MRNRFILLIFAFIIFEGCCPQIYVPNHNPDPLPPFYVPEKIRVALVLGSGGIRGMAHLGVLEELEEAGIPIDIIVGCSAGSIVGALYADNPNVQEIKSAVWNIRTDYILDIDLINCRYGLSQGRCLRRLLNFYLTSRNFEELKIPLIVVASDLCTGELVPIGSGDLVQAVQASCSIPFVFAPCQHYDRVLVDGGVINPVPVKVARDLGADIVIAVDLCELLPKTFPNHLFGVITRSAEIAFRWQNEVCTHRANVIIRPKTCGVGTFNEKMKNEIYESGRRAAREQIAQIKACLNALPSRYFDGPQSRCLVQLDPYPPEVYHEEPCDSR